MDEDGWMDGCMHAWMYVCMYGPMSRVPESVSLGDHTIGGARDPEPGLIHIYTYIYIDKGSVGIYKPLANLAANPRTK